MCAALVTTVTFSHGCVLPPEVTSLEDVDNRPPRIVPRSLSPDPLEGPVQLGCEPRLFFARLEDPDPDDVLYWRVFVNFDRDTDPFAAEVLTTRAFGDSAVISFAVDPADERFVGDVGEAQTVELFVADREFIDDPVGKPQAHTPAEGALTASFIWPVVLTEECAP